MIATQRTCWSVHMALRDIHNDPLDAPSQVISGRPEGQVTNLDQSLDFAFHPGFPVWENPDRFVGDTGGTSALFGHEISGLLSQSHGNPILIWLAGEKVKRNVVSSTWKRPVCRNMRAVLWVMRLPPMCWLSSAFILRLMVQVVVRRQSSSTSWWWIKLMVDLESTRAETQWVLLPWHICTGRWKLKGQMEGLTLGLWMTGLSGQTSQQWRAWLQQKHN